MRNSCILFEHQLIHVPARIASNIAPKSFPNVPKILPDFDGEEGNLDCVQQWMRKKFSKETKADVYPHFTTAVNRRNIEFVFHAVRTCIMTINLDRYGLL